MNRFLIWMFLFLTGSVFGWCLELLFRRFTPSNKERKWIIPGFLTGPYVPLYGFGLCILYFLAQWGNELKVAPSWLQKGLILLSMGFFMTLIEYIAGGLSIKILHVRLWDYSREKCNFQGIICLRFSILWTLLGALYYFCIHPYILNALNWFSSNLAFSFLLGMFFGFLLIDLFYTLGLVNKIRKFARENKVLVRYEELKASIRRTAEERRERYAFFFAFRSRTPLSEHLKNYIAAQKAFRPLPHKKKKQKT